MGLRMITRVLIKPLSDLVALIKARWSVSNALNVLFLSFPEDGNQGSGVGVRFCRYKSNTTVTLVDANS